MFVSENYTFNNVYSEDLNVILIHTDESVLQQRFTASKDLIKDKPRYRDKSFYYGADKKNIEFPIKITKADGEPFTLEERMDIMEWMCPSDNQYHEFISDDYPGLSFWMQFKESEFDNYFSHQGFILLSGESYLPYPTTAIGYSNKDLSNNTTSTIIKIPNDSNIIQYYKPMMDITMVGTDTTVKIINHSDNNSIFQFTNLTVGETISIDNDSMQILSSTGNSRIDNFNYGFLRLRQGLNSLEVFGKCKITFKLQFPMQI